MIRNYIKIAWRNLTKILSFSFINVMGLALGMVCCLFIFLWVQDERAMDNFHANGPRLYTAYQTITANGKQLGNYGTPIMRRDGNATTVFLMEEARQAVPEIQHVVFYATGYELPWGHPETFQLDDKKVKLRGARASEDFFKVLSYPLLEGNDETALNNIDGVAISRKMAEMFFGSHQEAVGKTLRYENKMDFIVTAVFDDVSSKSSLGFDFLLNWEAQKTKLEWASPNFKTIVQLSPQADAVLAEKKINQFLSSNFPENKGVKTTIGLQPYGNQYLHGNFVQGKPVSGRIDYVRIFSGVAIFILCIACINFMVLATARSIKRAKEVGMRKVLGSHRLQLIGQFYSEAFLLSLLAAIAALSLTLLLLPIFGDFTGKQFDSPFSNSSFWLFILTLMLITTCLAGSYPALFLSSLKPVLALKGVLNFSKSAIFFRKGLTVFQFGLSILLLVATFIISKQTGYVQKAHLGYDRDHLLYVRIEGELMDKDKYHLFKELASKRPGVEQVDRSSEAPHMMGFVVDEKDGFDNTTTGDDAINWQGKEKNASVGFKPVSVGYDFVKLMNLQLAEGRDFSRTHPTDSADAFLVNEEAVRQMGIKDPIGKWISAWDKKGHIIGVLKDYHTHSLHEKIKPLVMDVKEYEYFGVMLVRLSPERTQETLADLEAIYASINPDFPFDYQFIDEEYQHLYQSEQVMAKLSNGFAALAILISCLGLLGLVIFSAEQRTKEIGIRKVLGASVSGIVAMLSKDFVKLVFMAILIASPIAWWSMSKWLEDFAYKIEIRWWMFLLAALVAIAVTIFTVATQAIKAALANPIKSLREE